MELLDRGPIRRLPLPSDWREDDEPISKAGDITFSSPANPAVRLSFYFRGKKVSDRTAANFLSALAKPPHSIDDAELELFEVVTRDASEPHFFTRKSASTQDLNGVRVLVIEGHWILNGVDCCAIFIDAEGDGRTIEEMYFLAPPNIFETEFTAFRKNFLNAIEWK